MLRFLLEYGVELIMLKIAICDDNIVLMKRLKKICQEYEKHAFERISIECFSNSLDFLHSKNKFDVIFMDIEMPQLDGISAGKIFREIDKEAFIIFVSGYEKYKPIAYGVHPFDYIDKPFNKDAIFTVLNDVIRYMSKISYTSNIKIKIGSESHIISAIKIRHIELNNRKINIYYENEVLSIYDTISSLYTELRDYGFLLPHSAYIINYRFIKTFKRFTVYLVDGTEIPISQKKYNEFERKFHEILRNKDKGRNL